MRIRDAKKRIVPGVWVGVKYDCQKSLVYGIVSSFLKPAPTNRFMDGQFVFDMIIPHEGIIENFVFTDQVKRIGGIAAIPNKLESASKASKASGKTKSPIVEKASKEETVNVEIKDAISSLEV